MVREALAHVPHALKGYERWSWIADSLNNAVANPHVRCPCCGVTPDGDVADGDWTPK